MVKWQTVGADHLAAFHASAVPSILLDIAGVVLDANAAYLGTTRRERHELVGLGSVRLLHPDDVAAVVAATMLLTAERPRVVGRRRHLRGDGTVAVLRSATTLLPGGDRLLVEVLEAGDVDDAERATAVDAADPAARLRLAFGDGVIVHDDEGRAVKCLPATAELLGCGVDDVLGRRLTDPAFGPLDTDGAPLAGAADPVVAALRTGDPAEPTIGVTLPDGSVRWLSVKVEPVPGAGAAPPSAVSFLRDVSAVVALEEDRRRLATIVERSTDVVLAWDAGERLRWANGAARAALGVDPGAAVVDLLSPSAAERWAREVRPELAASGRWRGELDLLGAGGRVLPVDISVVADEGAPPVGASAVAHDLTERIRLERELAHRASHDPLTGLANRTLLLAVLDEELEKGRPVAVAFLDLDGFKAVNDAHGHAAGDRVLVEVAARLGELAPPGALVARAGGDEFVVVAATEAEASTFAASLGAELGEHGVRASVGVATAAGAAGGGRERAADLLARADAAMYGAKRARQATRGAELS